MSSKTQGSDGQLAGNDGETHDQLGVGDRGANSRTLFGKSKDRSTTVQHDASVSSFHDNNNDNV